MLVFEDAIDAALNPELHHVVPQDEPLRLQDAVDNVRQAFPEADVARIELVRAPDEALEIKLRKDHREVFVNPYTAQVLGSRLPRENLTGFLFELHVELLAGLRARP